MILLFTDFGSSGPYLAQMQAVLQQQAAQTPVIDLLNDAPTGNPRLSSYLLAALRHSFPQGSIFLGVVDPGVGGARLPVVLEADGQYFVGPDNGLFNTVALQSRHCQWQQISWQPEHCSKTFHGRDIFAPVAANLAEGKMNDILQPIPQPDLHNWQPDLTQVIYFDHYGNAMTGLRYQDQYIGRRLSLGAYSVSQAETYNQMQQGAAFWYKNSSGLIEIAVNQGNAKNQLGIKLTEAINFL